MVDERVVLVLGASSGIGRACAEGFARRGARLVLASRSSERLLPVHDVCHRLGATATKVVATDVLDGDQVGRCVEQTLETFGRVDVVVQTAAVMAYGAVAELPAAVFERVVDTSVRGTLNVSRAVLPVFRAQNGGTWVIVTSLLASVPVPLMGAYITAKWGQLGLARVLQLETRGDAGIHVCTVAPGSVDTPIFRAAANYAGRVGRPPPPVSSAEKVARVVLRRADHPRRNTSVGPANAVITLGYRLLPPVYDRLVTPLVRLAALSRQERAPTDGNVFSPSD
jgi:NAD(P)-dependent dehydrogenase (short-subunit alcohol dehydrogenase family)